jgi:phenylacetate-CoA ligase
MGLYTHLVQDILYPADLWRRGDMAILRYSREFERTQFLPAEEIRAIQLRRLKELLAHAYERCPFYRRRFEEAKLTPGEVKALEDLARLPTLEKREIQEHRDEMVASGWPSDDLVPNMTGGSTGHPLSFFLSQDRCRSRTAATLRHNRWAGWEVGDRAAWIWGAPRDRPVLTWKNRLRSSLLEPMLFLDAGHITEDKLARFHEDLKQFRPKVILGYSRALVLFAKFLQAKGLTPTPPGAIITTAEVLEPEDRTLLESVFGCRVFNRYGCREVSMIASECDKHQGLHVMAEGLFVEVIRGDGTPAAPGETGQVLVTDLMNYAMPLIRYRIGDMAAWEPGACPCGRGLPRLRNISGRVTEFLIGADGRLVSGAAMTINLVAKRPSLGQVQIHQDEFGKVLFRIHPGAGFNETEDRRFIEEAARYYLGQEMVVDLQLVDEMKPEPSGKFLFSRSTLTPDYLRSRPATAAPTESVAKL